MARTIPRLQVSLPAAHFCELSAQFPDYRGAEHFSDCIGWRASIELGPNAGEASFGLVQFSLAKGFLALEI